MGPCDPKPLYIYISYIQILLGLDFVSPGDPGLTEEEVKILLQGAAMGDAESQVLIGRMALEGPARGEGHGYGEKGSDDPKKSQDIPKYPKIVYESLLTKVLP